MAAHARFDSKRKMNGHFKQECPICYDGFKRPKLLPCAHTFCAECLQTCMRKTRRQHEVLCPLCRSCIKLPQDGVSGLLTNFFTSDDRIFGKPHFSDQSDEDKTFDADKLNSSRDEIDDAPLPSQFSRLGIYSFAVCTKLRVTLLNAFMVSGAESSADGCMNSVFGLPDSECMTILSGGPFLVKFRLDGTETQRIRVPEGHKIYDTICRSDGSILVTSPEHNKILMYKNESWTEFASTGSDHIVDMSSFADGRVVIGVIKDTIPYRSGELSIHSSNGTHLDRIKINNETFIPLAVAVNKKTDHVCLSDSFNHCVWILQDNGSLIAKYTTELSPLAFTNCHLIPLGLSTDRAGNIFLADQTSQSLHVINGNGRFLGVLSTDDHDQFGNPFSVHVGFDDVIWIGDREDAVVRAFKITDFINNI